MSKTPFLTPAVALAVAYGAAYAADTAPRVSIDVDVAKRGAAISDLHYGIFFEEINHAGDGGLYAELIANRSFEDNATQPVRWEKSASTDWKIITDDLLSSAQQHALQASFPSGADYIENTGFWGVNIVEGDTYTLSLWVRTRDGWHGDLSVSLRDTDGNDLGSCVVPVESADGWTRLESSIIATGSSPRGSLRIQPSKAGTLSFDMVSLFPPTFLNRPNGCRKDLAQMLADLNPAFMRFPGGCYVEGMQDNGTSNRFEWKKTIGPIEQRPGHLNRNWNYRVSDGLGFHEMLQLCEDIGAEPLFVVNIGLGHGWLTDYREIDEYIQEALDAIEYCNGSTETYWGAQRAANGHPEPFNLRLIEVGNENYQAEEVGESDHYSERYKAFYDAIKNRWPDINVIGNVEAWGTDSPSWRNSYPVDAVDEHYYRSPDWFISNYGKYDSYDRSWPKVYVGEYAVTQYFGTNGHLYAALGEAAYLLGTENNSDMVVMTSYAPIFINENDPCWQPDMIRFDASRSCGTPSYYVQQMMPRSHGSRNVGRSEDGNLAGRGQMIGLSSWSTSVSYDNVKVTSSDGEILFYDDFSSDSGRWHGDAAWQTNGGALHQTDGSQQGAIFYCDAALPDSYIYEFDAVRHSGAEGFLAVINYGDPQNYVWWNIAGWGNTQHAVEICSSGAKSSHDVKAGSIESGKTYHVRMEVSGNNLKCYLDGKLIHSLLLPYPQRLYTSASIDESDDRLFVKIVNPHADAIAADIHVAGATPGDVSVEVLTSAGRDDENSLDNPTNIVPAAGYADSVTDGVVAYTAPAYSFSVLCIGLSDVKGSAAGASPTEAQEEEARAELEDLRQKLSFLHAPVALPTTLRGGAVIEWNVTEGQPELSVTGAQWSARLETPALTPEKRHAGILTATVTYPDGAVGDIDFPVTMAPSDGMAGYLYCFMNAGKEITNFALGSIEGKGKEFEVMLNGDEIFNTAELAGIEHGTRDAFLARGQRADEYFMTVTDMCNATSGVWNNHGIELLRSSDLMHWESSVFDFNLGRGIFSDPEATDGVYTSDSQYAVVNRIWAPQFIFDPEAFNGKGGYLVYYSVLSPSDRYDRIVYSYADLDFKTLTQPRLFFDPGFSVIDADIVLNPYDGRYHMFLKREGAAGIDRGVYEVVSDRLIGGEWEEVLHVTNEGEEQVEGSTLLRRIDEDVYNLYYMRYSGGNAYRVCELNHLCKSPGSSVNVTGDGKWQHGSVMTVTADEYAMLQAWNDVHALCGWARAIGSDIFTDALDMAEAAMRHRSVSLLLQSLSEARDALLAAKARYVESMVNPGEVADISSLIANPKFSTNGDGWRGTAFTAVAQGVAEHYNTTFDSYQVLEGMPAGLYTLSCDGFYRCGPREAYLLHTAGTEQLNALLYLNEASVPLMSIFHDEYPYTYEPTYSYPDNVATANFAFNSARRYGENAVSVRLSETGDLRLGLRKSANVSWDWACFDNFRLLYNPDPDSVEQLPADSPDAIVNVYTPTGILIRRDVVRTEATDGLPSGIYIVGDTKVVVAD